MADGCLRRFNCFFAYSALLLLGVSLHDVEASSCDRIIHKKVGDTVELPSCLPTEGVNSASWKYNNTVIVEKDIGETQHPQFRDRVDLNSTDFRLTVSRLTLQDSGVFSLISDVDNKQRATVFITLQVHEPITKQPILTINSTWHALNESCTVVLECSTTSDRYVSYNWIVSNQTSSGSSLQYNFQPKDGDIEFTCTISNFVSEKSASKKVKCSNGTSTHEREQVFRSWSLVWLIAGIVIAISLTILLLFLLRRYTKSKDLSGNRLTQSQTVNQDETQQQVYSSLLHGDGSVYESLRGSINGGNSTV